MQSYPLTIEKFLDHAAKWWGTREVVSATGRHTATRITYADLCQRSNRLSGALRSLGLMEGDRVGTLAWNTQHHLEMYYATVGAGFVCHTLNPRFTVQHLANIINEAEDRVLAVAANLLPLLTELAPLCETLEHCIILDERLPETPSLQRSKARLWFYESWLSEHGAPVPWGQFNENAPAGLCYTSGTTGKPRGVLYTHRSNYLHTLRSLQADAFALRPEDVLLVAVPMFHANGWGLPYAAPAVGSSVILPGRDLDGESLARLMKQEKVTIAAGVQTVWIGVLDYLDATGEHLPDLQRVVIGGSKCPDSLLRRMEKRLGALVQTSWGMTELSPLGTISPATAGSAIGLGSGRSPAGLDMKITDREGRTLPRTPGHTGHLKVKGASVVDRYYRSTETILDGEGYFDTGDLASIDAEGNLTIRGRAKDLIKSGGEWINPAEIEEVIGQQAGVEQVAVVARPDSRWGERPVLLIEPSKGHELHPERLLEALSGRVATWWIPDTVEFVDAMPLAATGKIDKKKLRERYASAE